MSPKLTSRLREVAWPFTSEPSMLNADLEPLLIFNDSGLSRIDPEIPRRPMAAVGHPHPIKGGNHKKSAS